MPSVNRVLVAKVFRTVETLMQKHKLAVGAEGSEHPGASVLRLVKGSDPTELVVVRGKGAAITAPNGKVIVSHPSGVASTSGAAERDIDAFLARVTGLTCSLPRLYVPYGYVENGRVVAIYVATKETGAPLYLRDGWKPPRLSFFSNTSSIEERSRWFWNNAGRGKLWTPLRSRFEKSCKMTPTGLLVTGDTDKPALDGSFICWSPSSRTVAPMLGVRSGTKSWPKLTFRYA